MPSASVTLSRTHADDVRQRQIYVRIDDQPARTMVFGDTLTFDVEPGDHVLKANNTIRWKSVPFSVKEGEHARFVMINKAGPLTFGFLATLGVGPLKLIIQKI